MTEIVRHHGRSGFGTAVFWSYLIVVGSFAAAGIAQSSIGTIINPENIKAAIQPKAPGISRVAPEGVTRPSQDFDHTKGMMRYVVLTKMMASKEQLCTLDLLKQDMLDKPGSNCRSFGDYLIYSGKQNNEYTIILGKLSGRNVKSLVVIAPNTWKDGERQNVAVNGFNWEKAAKALTEAN